MPLRVQALPAAEGRAAGEDVAAPSLIAVVPTYNERDNLPRCVRGVLAQGERYGVLVVDDNSPDGTGVVADALAAEFPGRVSVLHRPGKSGLGSAYVAGLQQALTAGADLIATMDADLSHDPADLPRLAAALATQEVAIGSRYAPGGGTEGWPLYRRLLSRWGGRYAAIVLGVPLADPTSGFKLFRRAALRDLDVGSLCSDGYAFNIEIAYRALRRGARVVEVPILFVDRVAGRSKLSRRIMLEAAVVVWRLRLANGRGTVAPSGRPAPGVVRDDQGQDEAVAHPAGLAPHR